jgi:hypothetical protein
MVYQYLQLEFDEHCEIFFLKKRKQEKKILFCEGFDLLSKKQLESEQGYFYE